MHYNTLGDLIASLRSYIGNDAAPIKAAACRKAAFSAFEALMRYGDWRYYKTVGRVITVPAYSTGTVTFDYTGGAYERVLTLAGGAWPEWMAYGSVILDATIYDVAARKSDTQITLPAAQNPGADASYDSFTAVRLLYPMPADFVAADQLVCASTNNLLMQFTPRDYAFARAFREGPSQPREFTFIGSRVRNGTMELALYPPPDAAYPFDFLYRRRPARPAIDEEKAGRVSVTGTAVTGVGTSFAARHVGCVMRFSTTADAPTGDDGTNPPSHESRVAAVTDETTLTLEDDAPDALAGVGYTLSSQLDVETGAMYALLVELGRKELRIAQRINLTNEELEQFNRAVQAARAAQGQLNTTRTIAGARRPDQRYSEYPTRTDW